MSFEFLNKFYQTTKNTRNSDSGSSGITNTGTSLSQTPLRRKVRKTSRRKRKRRRNKCSNRSNNNSYTNNIVNMDNIMTATSRTTTSRTSPTIKCNKCNINVYNIRKIKLYSYINNIKNTRKYNCNCSKSTGSCSRKSCKLSKCSSNTKISLIVKNIVNLLLPTIAATTATSATKPMNTTTKLAKIIQTPASSSNVENRETTEQHSLQKVQLHLKEQQQYFPKNMQQQQQQCNYLHTTGKCKIKQEKLQLPAIVKSTQLNETKTVPVPATLPTTSSSSSSASTTSPTTTPSQYKDFITSNIATILPKCKTVTTSSTWYTLIWPFSSTPASSSTTSCYPRPSRRLHNHHRGRSSSSVSPTTTTAAHLLNELYRRLFMTLLVLSICHNNDMEADNQFIELLTNLKGGEFIGIFKEHNIDEEALKVMKPTHLDFLIPKNLFGARIKFEHNLLNWQKANMPNDPNNLSAVSEDEEFNIEVILKATVAGRSVLAYYDGNKTLIQKYRRMIAGCVSNFLIENKIVPSPKTFSKIAEKIANKFETECKDIYYIYKKGRKPGGVLYSKYHNSIGNLKDLGLIENKNKSKSNNEVFSNIELESDDNEILLDKEWLQCNIDPMSEVLSKWENTFQMRVNYLKSDHDLNQILQEWPIYKQSFGSNLILADFSKLYPGKEHLLDVKWEPFCTQILKIYDRDVKDQESLAVLAKYKELEFCSDVRDCIVLDLIHSVLKPTNRKCIKIDSKRRKYEKPSIADSKNSFIVWAPTASELNSKIKLLIDKTFKDKQTLQPFICAIGSSIFEFKEYFVHFGNILYKLQNIKYCLDLCFKIFNSINLKYPENCTLVWLFIQEYFYEIIVEDSDKSAGLTTILNDIQNI